MQGVLSNFLARFSRLALRILLLAFCGRSVSFYPAYSHWKFSLHGLELWQFPPVDKALSSVGIVALPVDKKLQNTKNYCSTTTSPQNEGCKLFAYAASHLLAHVKPSSKVPNRAPAVRFSKARHLSMHSSLSSTGVSWHTLMAPSSRPSIT